MLRTRIIPALLLRDESLVKTERFGKFNYVGDPCNTVRIFNELEVDELVFLDITATREGREPNLTLLAEDIGDYQHNQTRFVLVAREGIPAPTGHDRTALVVYQRADEPGSLISILQEFAARRINLSNLLSRPTKEGGLGDYCFIVYLDGHVADELVADAMRALHSKQGHVKFLGSYPAAGAAPSARAASVIVAPCAEATKNGVPPTERNERTGEFTPPGITACARAKSSSLRLMLRASRPSRGRGR